MEELKGYLEQVKEITNFMKQEGIKSLGLEFCGIKIDLDNHQKKQQRSAIASGEYDKNQEKDPYEEFIFGEDGKKKEINDNDDNDFLSNDSLEKAGL
jgi:hypothetical protein